MVDAEPVPQVSRFEANLLRIVRFILGRTPAEEAVPLIREPMPRPPLLSLTAVNLVCDTLAKGLIHYLVAGGGWKRERYLKAGEPSGGRLWQRHGVDELRLHFSRHALDFLIWLTAHRPADTFRLESCNAATLTLADQVLFLLMYEALRDEPDIVQVLRGLPGFADNTLCRLLYAGEFAADGIMAPVDFTPWLTAQGVPIIEALQSKFAARWLQIEHGKSQIADWQQLRRQGQAEAIVLAGYLDAIEKAGRRDLARFVLEVFARLPRSPGTTTEFWIGGLLGSGPARLAERLEIQRCALVFLQQATRLRQWEQQARETGFFDEDYAAGKFWLGEWERLNAAETTARALEIVQSLEPLRPASE